MAKPDKDYFPLATSFGHFNMLTLKEEIMSTLEKKSFSTPSWVLLAGI
jgi:hypothetical protein